MIRTEQFQWSAHDEWQPPLENGSLTKTAQLVLAFGSPDAFRASRQNLQDAYPNAQIVGCSTAGEIQKATVRDATLAVTAVQFEHTRVKTNTAVIASPEESFAAGRSLICGLDRHGLRHVIVLTEGRRVNASELVNGINSALPPGVVVSGGFAGDGNRLESTHVWCNGEPQRSLAAAIGFYGERLRAGVAAIGGWKPFGTDRLITRSQGNVLYEVDNKPVLALYKQYLGKHAEELPAAGLMFPLEVVIDGNRVLRGLLGVNEDEQSITYAGNVPEGAYARFMVGHTDDLVDGTEGAARTSISPLDGTPAQLSLLVSCNGRRFVLKQRVEEEVEAVREVLGPATAITGFYSYGEIAPAATGYRAELHNETMTVTSLAEV